MYAKLDLSSANTYTMADGLKICIAVSDQGYSNARGKFIVILLETTPLFIREPG